MFTSLFSNNKVMLYKIFLFLLFFNFSSISAQVEDSHKQNNIFLEILGNSILYSINYDRMIVDDFSFRLGIMALPSKNPDIVFAFPFLLNHKFYFDKDYIEVGIGKTFFEPSLNFAKEKEENSILTGTLGYCFQFNSGFFLRICFTPIIYKNDFISFGGFSIGYNF